MPMMNEAGVDRVCIVPPSWEGDRVDYAIEAAGKFPGRFGIMGRIALGNPQSATLLPTWKEQTGMLGIRVSFTYPQQYEKLSDGSLDWFWPACEKAGIPLMFNAPGRMPAYARIAERHPQLRLVADHMGLSGDIARANMRESAIEATAALAKYPNVSVKLSSAPMYSFEPYPWRDTSVVSTTRTVRSAAIGEPTSPTRSPRRLTTSASRTSPRNSRSSLRTTRTGSWAAHSRHG